MHTFRTLWLAGVFFILLPVASMALTSGPDGISAHPYEAALSVLKEEGVMQGYPDGQFRPDNVVNRAEFMKIVLSAKGIAPEGRGCFPDVGDQWFAPWVCAATELGIVSGYPDGFFRPEQTISFVEAAKMLAKASNAPDGEQSPWYKGFVEYLGSHGAIPPSISSFGHLVTRGETAAMVWLLREGDDQARQELASQTLLYDFLQAYTPKERVLDFEGTGKKVILTGTRLDQLCTPVFSDANAAQAPWEGETPESFYLKYCLDAWSASVHFGWPEYYPYARDAASFVQSNPGGYQAMMLMTSAQVDAFERERVRPASSDDSVTSWTECERGQRVLADTLTAVTLSCTSYYQTDESATASWFLPVTHCFLPAGNDRYLAYVIPQSALDSGDDGCRQFKRWGVRSVRMDESR